MADQRASDADRERAVEHLRRAGGDGRLDLDELDERLEQAHGARTRGALDALLADLRAPGEVTVSGTGSAPSGVVVRRGPGGTGLVLSIMGGAKRTGRWRVARRCVVVNVMGGCKLDLNDAELADDVVEVTVVTLLGGGDIRVPEGLRVEVADVGLLGSNDVERGRPELQHDDGPVLRLRLVSVLGGVSVRRGRARSWTGRHLRHGGIHPPAPPRP